MIEDPRITEYRQACKLWDGREPEIIKRGAWLVIGSGSFPIRCRVSDLPQMTGQLLYRARLRAGEVQA